MRHLKRGRKLDLSGPQRNALFRSMTLSLIEKERITTTLARAKEVRRLAERVVTLAKDPGVSSRRRCLQLLGSTEKGVNGTNRTRSAMEKLYSEIAPRFKTRNGGYTQILRLANHRLGDYAQMCFLQYIPEPEKSKPATAKKAADVTNADKKKEKKSAAEKAEKAPKDKTAVKSKEKPKDK